MRKIRIALVEDSQTDIIIYKNVISKIESSENINIDYEIFTTLDDLKNNFSKSKFDLLITDDNIPGGCSADVLKFIRKTHDSDSLPSIVISASLDDERIFSAYEAGTQEFLLKQNSPKVLQTAITKFLNLNSSHIDIS